MNKTLDGECRVSTPEAAVFDALWHAEDARLHPAPTPRLNNEAQRGEGIREEYAKWLEGYNFDYFLTSTFRSPRIEPYYALKNVWGELRQGNVRRGFLVAEPHQSGDLHVHGIVAGGLPKQEQIDLPWKLWGRLFDRFGRAKVEAPNKHECVSMYCAKYLLKQQHRACDFYEVFGDKVYWHSGELQKPALVRAALAMGAEYNLKGVENES